MALLHDTSAERHAGSDEYILDKLVELLNVAELGVAVEQQCRVIGCGSSLLMQSLDNTFVVLAAAFQ